jgi:outer membrane protein TolC
MKRISALLAACVVASSPAHAQNVPPSPAAPASAAPAPEPAPTAPAAPPEATPASSVPTVSLKQALRRAQADPPSVLAAVAAYARSQATESLAESAWLPKFTAQGTAGIGYDNRIVYPDVPRLDSKALSTQIGANLEWVGLSASRGGDIDAARAAAKAQGLGKEGVQRVAMALAAEMYVRAYAATDLVRDAQLSLERRTNQHQGILALVRTGLRQPIEAQRAEVEAVSARYVLAARQEEELAAWASLAVALGQSPAAPVRPEGPAGSAFDVVFPPAVAREVALRNRPERKQAEAIVVQRDEERSAAKGARLPTMGIQGSATAGYFENIGGFGITGSQYGANAFVYLRWSGLDPAVWFKKGVAEAAAVESRRQLDVTSLAMAAEAVQRAHDVIRARTERDRAVAVLSAAEVTREAQNGRYKAGLASLLELLDAENLEQNARRGRIESERDYQIAGARLLSSCGLLTRLTQ